MKIKLKIMNLICSCLLIVIGSACGSKNDNKGGTGGPVDGIWKLTDVQCEGVSVLHLLPYLAGQSWNINNTSGTWKMPDSLDSATLSLEITYPSTGKLSYHITDGPNFNSDEEKRKYLRDTVKQVLFVKLTNGSTKGTINYSIDGNALRFTREGDNDCEDLGYSGAITNIAVRE